MASHIGESQHIILNKTMLQAILGFVTISKVRSSIAEIPLLQIFNRGVKVNIIVLIEEDPCET